MDFLFEERYHAMWRLLLSLRGLFGLAIASLLSLRFY